MSDYTYPNENVNVATLTLEVEEATWAGGNMPGVRTDLLPGGNRDVMVSTPTALSAGEETELDGIIAAHTP